MKPNRILLLVSLILCGCGGAKPTPISPTVMPTPNTSACVLYGETVALSVKHPGGPRVYLSEGSTHGDALSNQVYFSHVPHYQWQFLIDPSETPVFGNCITASNDLAIYNRAKQEYLVRDGDRRIKFVWEGGLSGIDPYQWRVQSTATYPLLERFWIRHATDKWELVASWDHLGLIPPDYPAYGETPPFYRFHRLSALPKNEMDINEIPECCANCTTLSPSIVRTLLELDEVTAQALDYEVYNRSVGSYEIADISVGWFGSGMGTYPFERQTLRGTLEKYSNYIPTLATYPIFPENDWNLEIYPDPDSQWMTYLNVGENADHQRSDHPDHEGAILVVGELTPSRSLFDTFYWLPISDSGTFHYGPLVNHKVNIYGVYALDWGHGGRPEIHPFDAIWWEDWDYEGIGKWYYGVFQDDSERFNEGWSRSPVFEDTWSVPPRAIIFNFPFSIQLPQEKERDVRVIIEIGPESNWPWGWYNNVVSEVVFGPDETEQRGELQQGELVFYDPYRLIWLDEGRKVVDIRASEFCGNCQNTHIEILCKCGNMLYGQVKISAAVGEEGTYFGEVAFRERRFQTDEQAVAPFLKTSVSQVDFVGTEVVFDQMWHHYRAELNIKPAPWTDIPGLQLPQYIALADPNQLVINLPETGVTIPFQLENKLSNVQVNLYEGTYQVEPRQILPEPQLLPRLSSSPLTSKEAMQIVAGTLEKQRSDLPNLNNWAVPLDIYINPSVMTGASYPTLVQYALNFPDLSETVKGNLFIPRSSVPNLVLSIVGIDGPKVVTENGRKRIAFYLELKAEPHGLEKPLSWYWQPMQYDDVVHQGVPATVGPTGTFSDHYQILIHPGDEDIWIGAQARYLDGTLASGILHVDSVGLWSRLIKVEDTENLAGLPGLKERFRQDLVNVDSELLLSPEIISDDGAVKVPVLKESIGVKTQNVVILTSLSGYFPYRSGQIFAEEESVLAERMNETLTEGEANRLKVFGSSQPFSTQWKVTARDLNGNIIPLEISTLPFGESLATVDQSPPQNTALLILYTSVFTNDTAILLLPVGQPFTIEGEMTIQDVIGLSNKSQIIVHNYQIVSSTDAVYQLTGVSSAGIREYLEQACRQWGILEERLEFCNPWPSQLGYINLIKILHDELDSLSEDGVSPLKFEHILMLIKDIYNQSTTDQRNALFGR